MSLSLPSQTFRSWSSLFLSIKSICARIYFFNFLHFPSRFKFQPLRCFLSFLNLSCQASILDMSRVGTFQILHTFEYRSSLRNQFSSNLKVLQLLLGVSISRRRVHDYKEPWALLLLWSMGNAPPNPYSPKPYPIFQRQN